MASPYFKADLDAELAAKQARLAAERRADREGATAMAEKAAGESRAAEDRDKQRRQDAVREQRAALDQKRLWDKERFREQWAFENGERGGGGGGTGGGGGGGGGGAGAGAGGREARGDGRAQPARITGPERGSRTTTPRVVRKSTSRPPPL